MLDLMSSFQLHFLLMIFAGWVNRRQQGVIEYLQEENRVVPHHYSEFGLRGISQLP